MAEKEADNFRLDWQSERAAFCTVRIAVRDCVRLKRQPSHGLCVRVSGGQMPLCGAVRRQRGSSRRRFVVFVCLIFFHPEFHECVMAAYELCRLPAHLAYMLCMYSNFGFVADSISND